MFCELKAFNKFKLGGLCITAHSKDTGMFGFVWLFCFLRVVWTKICNRNPDIDQYCAQCRKSMVNECERALQLHVSISTSLYGQTRPT